MKNEVKLVNEVEGSILNNEVMGMIGSSADFAIDQAKQIGELKGELKVAEQLIDQGIVDAQKAVQEADTHLTVTVCNQGNKVYDDYRGWMIEPTLIKHIQLEKGDLNKIADTAVKAQALKDVEAADKKAEEAKDKMDIMEKTCKRNEERAKNNMEDYTKSAKETIQKAVDSAEKQNVRNIASLEADKKALTKEADLLVDERDNMAVERDIALEAQEHQIRLLKNRINILTNGSKNILDHIKNRVNAWSYNRTIKRLSS